MGNLMTTDKKSGFYYIDLDDSTNSDIKSLSIHFGVSIEELLEVAVTRYAAVEWSNIKRKEKAARDRARKRHERRIESLRMQIIIGDFMTNIKPQLEQESNNNGEEE